MTVAFYAPLKPPDDPTPSGDRTLARALLAALQPQAPRLASRLRSRDGAGDAGVQARIRAAARAEARRLSVSAPCAVWLTYHNYYKAPDLLGPTVSRAWGAAYAVVEASRSGKRRVGPWAGFAAEAEAASDRADVVFYMTERDRPALAALRPPAQRLVHLRPFLAREQVAPPRPPRAEGPLRLLAVAMMREGDKRASYAALAAALARTRGDWRLDVVGDGPARGAVEAALSPFGDRARFWGALAPDAVAERMRAADLLVWPGVGEAFGLVYLEAQAEGAPALAEDRPGVRDVVRAGGLLTPAGDAAAFAAALDALGADHARLATLGEAGRAQVAAEHLLGAARRTLEDGLAEAAEAARRRRR